MADLLERISALAERAQQLEQTLGQPAVASNPTEYRRIAQELSGLRPAAQAAQAYRKLLTDIEGARALLGEGDADMRALAQTELAELEEQRTALEKQVRVLLLPRDPDDEKGAILEIRAGAGGEEAGLFAHELLRMYLRYAERRGWKVEPMSLSQAGSGIREAITGLSGEGVFGRLKRERGVHRVQRVPATEAQGRIHTSTVTVAVLPEAEEVDVQINPADLRIDVYRSSGPGGQSVNTTDSAVRVTHLPTNTVVTCQDEKSQHKNKAKALKVLRSRLLEVERDRAAANRANARRAQVGTGDRSEKIRTYNFPQSRVTDHRAGVTMHQLDALLAGDMDELLDAVQSSVDEQELTT
jgi:peptide chain release factor 1